MNQTNYFPELDFNSLKSLSHGWGKRFPIIETIKLHKTSDPALDFLIDFQLIKSPDPKSFVYQKYLTFLPLFVGKASPDVNGLLRCYKDDCDRKSIERFAIHKGIRPEDWRMIAFDGLSDEQADFIRVADIFWALYTRKPESELLEQAKAAENAFICNGATWTIRFKGNQFDINNLDGVKYIAHMLKYPNRIFYPLELYYEVKGTPEAIKDPNIELKEDGFYEAKIEPEDRDLYASLIEEKHSNLEDAEKSGTEADIEKAKAEFDQLTGWLESEKLSFVISGGEVKIIQSPKLNEQQEKCRSNIQRAIKTTKDRIRKILAGENASNGLSSYLNDHILTGNTQKYRTPPDDPIEFIVYP